LSEQIIVSGLVATTPRHLVTQDGLPITSFRLAASQRRFDRTQNRWIDGDTNWYTITSFRQLAINVAGSVAKGERIVVSGKLRVRDWDNGERAGTSVEIEAESLGHDLTWGSSVFTRTVLVREADPADEEPDTESSSDEESDVEPTSSGSKKLAKASA
jgi:single-strand DNA-binding protein